MLEQYDNKPIIFEFDKETNRKMSSQRDASEKSFDTDDDFALIKHIKMEPETMLTQGDDIMAQLQHDSSDLEVEPSFSMEGLNGDDCNEGLMMQHMDIREPLSTLRNLLEQRLGIELTDYSFWLHTQMLESHKNLVDQCVQGEGLVQVNLHIKAAQRMINIVDVLKPAEDYVEVAGNNSPEPVQEVNTKQKVMRWVVDTHYKQEQLRLKIPEDPVNWTVTHVKHWLQWAVRHFNLAAIKLADWNITGAELCALTMDEFHEKVPLDPNDVFWTHLELLKTCKFVAVEQKNSPEDLSPEKNAKIRNDKSPKPRTAMNQNPRLISMPMGTPESSSQITLTPSTRSANSGQIQLWQFLLELLTDRDHRDAIQWVGTEGEFRLNQHETVARLWGQRKNKPSMNYEKLSRALRYYYDGDMISKVHGKRFVYKFVCDLKNVLGYSAAELSRLVAGGKKFGDSDPMTSPFI